MLILQSAEYKLHKATDPMGSDADFNLSLPSTSQLKSKIKEVKKQLDQDAAAVAGLLIDFSGDEEEVGRSDGSTAGTPPQPVVPRNVYPLKQVWADRPCCFIAESHMQRA